MGQPVICEACAEAADSWWGDEYRMDLHDKCIGCTCQHHRISKQRRLTGRIVSRGREHAEMAMAAEELEPLVALAEYL